MGRRTLTSEPKCLGSIGYQISLSTVPCSAAFGHKGATLKEISIHRSIGIPVYTRKLQLRKTIFFKQEFDKGKALEENIEKLALERKRSEDLLYRMMPKAIADRLRLGGKAVETCEV